MPLKDLPPVYRMDPELLEISHRITQRSVEYLGEGLDMLSGVAPGKDPNAILALGAELVAAQLNVLAHKLAQERKAEAPESCREMCHHDYVSIIANDIVRRALRRHRDGAI